MRSNAHALPIVALASLLFQIGLAPPADAAPPRANLDQARNGGVSTPNDPVAFVNGDANAVHSHYLEGHSIPYRLVLTNLAPGAHTVKIGWDIRDGGKNAIDYITRYDRLEPHPFGHAAETVDPLAGLAGSFGSPSTYATPAPSSTGSTVAGMPAASFNALSSGERALTIWNGSITGATYMNQGSLAALHSSSGLSIHFNATSSTVVLAWGGHIASQADWGAGHSASAINGAPYHTRLIDFDNRGGNQDRSLQSGAIVAPPTCGLSGPEAICANSTAHFSNTTGGQGLVYAWSLSQNSAGASLVGPTNGASVDVATGSGGSFTVELHIENA